MSCVLLDISYKITLYISLFFIYILYNRLIGPVGRVFTNDLGDQGTIPDFKIGT